VICFFFPVFVFFSCIGLVLVFLTFFWHLLRIKVFIRKTYDKCCTHGMNCNYSVFLTLLFHLGKQLNFSTHAAAKLIVICFTGLSNSHLRCWITNCTTSQRCWLAFYASHVRKLEYCGFNWTNKCK